MPQQQRELNPDASPLALFGAELRANRMGCGLSQARLGRMVHVSGDLLAKIEKAERRPNVDLVSRLDDVLCTDGRLAELFDSVELGEQAFPTLPSSQLPPGEVTAVRLRTVIRQIRQADHSHNVSGRVATLAGHAQAAEALLRKSGASRQRDLAAALAEANQLLGWISFDNGNIAGAENAFRTARVYAEQAGDSELVAYIAGPSHGFVTTVAGHPAHGVERTYGALGWARRTGNHRLTAFVLAVAARAHAKLGDATLCMTMLDDAETELDRHEAEAPDPDWLTVFDYAGLTGHRGSCLLDLGQPSLAIDPLTRQHMAAAELFVRNRSLWLLDRAKAFVQLKELDAACATIDQALDLVGDEASPRVQHRFHALGSTLGSSGSTAVDRVQRRIRGLQPTPR